MNLSVCLIVKDEARNLPGLFACLPLQDIELIVVDTGSQDATVEIAKSAGARVMTHPWHDDFSEARNVSIAAATRATILWLDADDRVEPQFWREIESLMELGPIAHRCIVRSPREDGSCESFLQIRLFPNHLGIQFDGRVHEQLGSSIGSKGIAIQNSASVITHVGYTDAATREVKSRRNARLLQEEYAAHPKDAAVALQYGNALCQMRDYGRGREVFWTFLGFRNAHEERAVPPDEREAMFPALIAETFEKSGEWNEALAWHALSRQWAPEYLRSGYILAKEALKKNDARAAFGHLHRVLERPPRIGLVACDNVGVRKNAWALLISMSMSPAVSQAWQSLGQTVETLHRLVQDGILELAVEEPYPLDRSALVAYLVAKQWWPSLWVVLEPWHPTSQADRMILEDAVEAVVLDAPSTIQRAVNNFLANHPRLRVQSGVLSALYAMLQERCAESLEKGRKLGWEAFQKALQNHPSDPTVLGQFALFADRHHLQAEAVSSLQQLPIQDAWIDEVLNHLRQTTFNARPLA